MAEPRGHYDKWKSQTEKTKILFDLIYMWNLFFLSQTYRSRVQWWLREARQGKWKGVNKRVQTCNSIGWVSLEIYCTVIVMIVNTVLNIENMLKELILDAFITKRNGYKLCKKICHMSISLTVVIISLIHSHMTYILCHRVRYLNMYNFIKSIYFKRLLKYLKVGL